MTIAHFDYKLRAPPDGVTRTGVKNMRGTGKVLRAAAVLIGTLSALGIGSSVSAQTAGCAPTQDPNVCVRVTAPTTVNTSTNWAITVDIENNHSNTLNRIRFSGSLIADSVVQFADLVTGQPPVAPTYPYTYLTTSNPAITCSVQTPGTGLTCGSDTTSLQPGQKFSFTVMSTVPAVTGAIDFAWNASFAEGNSTTGNVGTTSGKVTAEITAASGTAAAGSFPAQGGTLATAPDSFTTRIAIPLTNKTSNATITESPSTDPRCKSFRTCYSSEVTIPLFEALTVDDPLKIVLYMGEDNIRRGAKIENVTIYYTYLDASGNSVEVSVSPCSIPDKANGDGIPCLNKSVNYKNSRSTPDFTNPIGFGFYWQLLNTKNGGFGLF